MMSMKTNEFSALSEERAMTFALEGHFGEGNG